MRPIIVMAAKAHDVDLGHSGRKIAGKLGESNGVGSSMIILDRTAKATDNIRLKPGGHRVSQHKIQIALPKMRQYECENQGQGKQASSHSITPRAATGKEQATRSDGS